MFEAALNYWAVLVSGIALIVIGSLWYSPVLFGNMWTKLMGFTKESMDAAKKKGMAKEYTIQFIGSLVEVYVLAHFVAALGVTEWMGAAQLAFWIWLGFFLTGMLGMALWEGRSWKLVAIHAGHSLVSLVVAATILTYWK